MPFVRRTLRVKHLSQLLPALLVGALGCACLCGKPSPPAASCPLAAGAYTFGPTAGGYLRLATINPFDTPSGGHLTLDVGAGSPPDCEHSVVVPSPGGFEVPVFCIPALSFTVGIAQAGCGIGQIDSNGGADYTVAETGDTSDSSPQCNVPHPGCTLGANGAARLDVQVGDGAPDTCATGTANVALSVPVAVTFWLPKTFSCPDPDGVYNPFFDTLVLQFNQTLDLTTDHSMADWKDSDGDGCCLAGIGPASMTSPCSAGGVGPLSESGACLDVAGIGSAGNDVTLVSNGPAASPASPLHDLSTGWKLPGEVSGPAASLGAVCAAPPSIDFGGSVTRCLP